MKNKLYLLVTCITFINFYSFGQSKPKNPPPKKSEVIDVFGNDPNSSNDVNFSPTNSNAKNFKASNMLKLDVVQPFLGNFIFSFERNLTKRLGAELTAGPTLGTAVTNIINWFDDVDTEEFGAAEFGLYYGGQIKYYTDGYDAPEGWYLGLGFRRSQANYKKVDAASIFQETSLKTIKNTEFARISIGHTSFWDKLVSEYYITIGLKKSIKEYYNYKTNGITTLDGNNAFGFSFGYKLGISF